MRSKDCTILINSCDAYEDVWEPFFSVLKDRWKDCPYKIVLNTESKSFSFEGLEIETLNLFNSSGKDLWGRRLRQTLQSIDTKYVIALFDDFILEDDVQQDRIENCISWMEENSNIAAFYFTNVEGININDGCYEGFELLPQRKDYKLNSAPGLWNREKLLSFTGDKDTPWAWEFFGSARTYRKKDIFYCAQIGREDIYKYSYSLGGAIHRGKWVKSVIEPVVQQYNLDLDLSLRGFEDETLKLYKHTLKWKIRFLYDGFRMVGLNALIFVYRSIKKRIVRSFP